LSMRSLAEELAWKDYQHIVKALAVTELTS
jgi:hypothetical protein